MATQFAVAFDIVGSRRGRCVQAVLRRPSQESTDAQSFTRAFTSSHGGVWKSADFSTLRSVQELLLAWYSQNGRDLPWRKTRDPYAILVSEIMSQQTQV